MIDTCFQVLSGVLRKKFSWIFRKAKVPVGMPIRVQLLIRLYRLGHYGNGASVAETALRFGVSEGHVVHCKERVIKALTQLARLIIRWPSKDERRTLAAFAEEKRGFKGCIGSVDRSGTASTGAIRSAMELLRQEV